jgi:Tfp pilus assembly protein PilF
MRVQPAFLLICAFAVSFSVITCPASAQALQEQASPIAATMADQIMIQGSSSVIVHVQESAGNPLAVPASVKLILKLNPGEVEGNGTFTSNLSQDAYSATTKAGLANINGVGGGDYIVEVSAPGFQTAHDTVTVLGQYSTTNAFIKLHAFDGSDDQSELEQPGAPPISQKARRDVELALHALAVGKTAEAAPHVRDALKHAPENPDVHFIAATFAQRKNDTAEAEKQYQQAITLFPTHFAAQIGLGDLLLHQHDYAGSIAHLEKALAIGPNSWRGHLLLSEAYLQTGRDNLDKVRFQANRALELDKQKAVDAEITLALADALAGDRDTAREKLEKFVRDHPKDPGTDRAKKSIAMFDNAEAGKPGSVKMLPLSGRAETDSDLLAYVPPGAMLRLPAGVDDAVPPVTAGVTCALPQVLDGAARRSQEFARSLERFSAKETVSHDQLDAAGVARKSSQHVYDYTAALEHPRPDLIVMDELRDGSFGVDDFPGAIATEGIPAVGLIFNPAFSPDFTFSCEGLGEWKGQPVWQVRFEQKSNRPARIHDWVVNGSSFPTILKGRAWIATDSYNLLHVETDLVQPIKDLRLDYEHMSIQYQPVKLPSGKASLWLPFSAEVYTKYKGRFFRQEHDFSNFTLFSVNTNETIGTTPRKKKQDKQDHN